MSYGNTASQQTSILLPNRFTILQPPPLLATVLVLGELESVADGLGAGLGVSVLGKLEAVADGLGAGLEVVVEGSFFPEFGSNPGILSG